MDILKAPNLFDAFLLTFVFTCSFMLANVFTETTKAYFKEYVKEQEQPKDWLIFSLVITLLVIFIIFILRKVYK